MLEIFNDQVDGVRDQRQISFLKMRGRFQFSDNLLYLEAALFTYLIQGIFRIFVKADPEIEKNIRVNIVLIHQVRNTFVFQGCFTHESVNIVRIGSPNPTF